MLLSPGLVSSHMCGRIYDLRNDTVAINLVGLDFYDLTLGQPLVEDCVADEVRYSGIVIFFHPLAYDFFFLGREADVMKIFAVLAVFCFHDSKFQLMISGYHTDFNAVIFKQAQFMVTQPQILSLW